MSICFRYTEILEFDRYMKSNSTGTINVNLSDIDALEELFTVRDLFEFTPDVGKSLTNCGVQTVYAMNELSSGAERGQIFKIVKFYMQEYICYHYSFRRVEPLIYKNAARALRHINTIYYLTLNRDLFNNVTTFKAIMHTDNIPDIDADLAPPLVRVVNQEEPLETTNLYELTYFYVITRRMSPPYDTNCVNYSTLPGKYEDRWNCIDDCVIQQMTKKFDRVPFSNVVHREWPFKHVSNREVQNASFAAQIQAIEDHCEVACKRNDCLSTYLSTSVAISSNEQFKIIANIPNSPSFEIRYTEDMTLTSYIIFVCSCFNTWFGVSALSANPCPLILRIVNRRHRGKSAGMSGQASLSRQTGQNTLFEQVNHLKDGLVTPMKSFELENFVYVEPNHRGQSRGSRKRN